MSTSVIGIRFHRAPTLTVEIHSVASRFRRWISTSGSADFVDPRFTLTDRIHRIASGFAGRIFTPEHARYAIAGPHSPLKCTGLRVAAAVVVHRPNRLCRPVSSAPSPLKTAALRVAAAAVVHARAGSAVRPRTHPHRRKPQRFESLGETDIHMSANPLIGHESAFPRTATAGSPRRDRRAVRSGVDSHLRNTQCRESSRQPDIHTGNRVAFDRVLSHEPEMYSASDDVVGRTAAS